jgi:FG-GAP-like repeat
MLLFDPRQFVELYFMFLMGRGSRAVEHSIRSFRRRESPIPVQGIQSAFHPLAQRYVGFGEVSVLLGNGDGTFQTHMEYAVGWYDPIFVLIADFNRDGNADLAVADGDSYGINTNLSILLGQGDGSFPTHTDYAPNS